MTSMFPCRKFCTSSIHFGKKNFRKFLIPERGSLLHKERLRANPEMKLPRDHTVYNNGNLVSVPEIIPEIVVPDLTGFELKPYVSYRVREVAQSEFTAEDLFMAVYAKKISSDLKNGKLDEEGNSLEPSPEETLTADEAWIQARKTGSDIFSQRSKREEEELYDLKL